MKIAVLGCGAVGSLYAAHFAQNPDHQVLCVVKSPDHAERIRRFGISITDSSGAVLISASPEAVSDTSGQSPADLVLISVKSHTTAEAMQEHAALFGPETTALTLQNGYGNHEDILSRVPARRIIMGTTAMGVNITPEGRIIQAGSGKTVIGALDPESPEADALLCSVNQLLTDAGFETEITEDAADAVLRKLLINVGINAVCTLTNRQNRFIAEDPVMRDRSGRLVREAVQVINQALGRSYDEEATVETVLSVAQKTGQNVCSMLQDARNGRKTEIERINGAVVHLAETAGLPAPENTRIVKEILERF